MKLSPAASEKVRELIQHGKAVASQEVIQELGRLGLAYRKRAGCNTIYPTKEFENRKGGWE